MHKMNVLQAMSLVELLDLLNPDYSIARTSHEDIDRRYMIDHVYSLIKDVNTKQEDFEEWETFGIDFDVANLVNVEPVYASTARECLLKFFNDYPEMILQ